MKEKKEDILKFYKELNKFVLNSDVPIVIVLFAFEQFKLDILLNSGAVKIDGILGLKTEKWGIKKK